MGSQESECRFSLAPKESGGRSRCVYVTFTLFKDKNLTMKYLRSLWKVYGSKTNVLRVSKMPYIKRLGRFFKFAKTFCDFLPVPVMYTLELKAKVCVFRLGSNFDMSPAPEEVHPDPTDCLLPCPNYLEGLFSTLYYLRKTLIKKLLIFVNDRYFWPEPTGVSFLGTRPDLLQLLLTRAQLGRQHPHLLRPQPQVQGGGG